MGSINLKCIRMDNSTIFSGLRKQENFIHENNIFSVFPVNKNITNIPILINKYKDK